EETVRRDPASGQRRDDRGAGEAVGAGTRLGGVRQLRTLGGGIARELRLLVDARGPSGLVPFPRFAPGTSAISGCTRVPPDLRRTTSWNGTRCCTRSGARKHGNAEG